MRIILSSIMASFQFCEVFFCFAKILNNFNGNVNAWGTPRSRLKFGPPPCVVTFGQSFLGSSEIHRKVTG